jgi:hypothetical protein
VTDADKRSAVAHGWPAGRHRGHDWTSVQVSAVLAVQLSIKLGLFAHRTKVIVEYFLIVSCNPHAGGALLPGGWPPGGGPRPGGCPRHTLLSIYDKYPRNIFTAKIPRGSGRARRRPISCCPGHCPKARSIPALVRMVSTSRPSRRSWHRAAYLECPLSRRVSGAERTHRGHR